MNLVDTVVRSQAQCSFGCQTGEIPLGFFPANWGAERDALLHPCVDNVGSGPTQLL